MTYFIRLSLLLIATLVSPSSTTCPSPDWQQFRDFCYWRSNFSSTWSAAERLCQTSHQGAGATLVSIHDLDTDAFIGEQLLEETVAWLGLHRAGADGAWQWSDGSAYDFTMWYENEPDWEGGCAAVNWALMGRWVGFSCEESLQFICRVAAS